MKLKNPHLEEQDGRKKKRQTELTRAISDAYYEQGLFEGINGEQTPQRPGSRDYIRGFQLGKLFVQ